MGGQVPCGPARVVFADMSRQWEWDREGVPERAEGVSWESLRSLSQKLCRIK